MLGINESLNQISFKFYFLLLFFWETPLKSGGNIID